MYVHTKLDIYLIKFYSQLFTLLFAYLGEANQFRSAPNRGMVRGRGCNDSFRAAVDRSYDGPNNETETMETRKFIVFVSSKSFEHYS